MDYYCNKNIRLCERCSYLLDKIYKTDDLIKNIVVLMNHRENRLREQQLAGVNKDSIKICLQLLEDSILIHSGLLNRQRKRQLKLVKHYKKDHHND